jgi:HSP20 family protein
MTEAMQALNDVKDLYARFLGQPAPEFGPGWYAPLPPGVDPVRYAVQEVDELKKFLLHAGSPQVPVAWIPRADVFAGRDAVVIRLEIPGVKRELLKVLVADGQCVVRGERPAPAEDKKLHPLGLEFPFGTFERRFALPLHAAPDKLTAKYTDGILEVTVPIVEVPAPKEMKVEIA